jgi:hypothetical protein
MLGGKQRRKRASRVADFKKMSRQFVRILLPEAKRRRSS